MSAFAVFVWAFGFLLAGLSLAAFLLGVPLLWIIVADFVVVCLGFLIASSGAK